MLRRVIMKSGSEAVELMRRIGVDPRGAAIMEGKFAHFTFIASDLASAACNILKQEMLSIGGEAAVARGTVNLSVERSDALISGTRKQFESLVQKLDGQPFGLDALAGEIKSAVESRVPPAIKWDGYTLDFSAGPLLMGVLNITPDSFSDGGKFTDPAAAAGRAMRMVLEGASIIDIGGESSRPGADPLPPEEEQRRVIPVIERLAGRIKAPISIDTYHAETARAALDAGASMINDISGLRADPGMAALAAERKAPVVVMHMRGMPKTMQEGPIEYGDLMGEIASFLLESAALAERAGVDPARVVIDPGIGFGKTAAHNFMIISRLHEIVSLGKPVLVGPSKKSFLGSVTGKGPAQRGWGTAAAVAACVLGGAHIIRVHDTAEMRDVAAVAAALKNA
jgi:dihydropteroate synthase